MSMRIQKVSLLPIHLLAIIQKTYQYLDYSSSITGRSIPFQARKKPFLYYAI
jgi:hypothetical protein